MVKLTLCLWDGETYKEIGQVNAMSTELNVDVSNSWSSVFKVKNENCRFV